MQLWITLSGRSRTRTTSALLCAVLALLSPHAQTQAPMGVAWRLVLDDEFTKDSQLNSAIWGSGAQPWGAENSNTCTLVSANDTTVSPEGLRNRTEKGTFLGASGKTYQYADGVVWLRPEHWLTYGYIEIKAKYPNVTGAWPAFWMLRKGWPPEFDIAEYRGAPKAYMTFAFDNEAGKWDTSKVPDTGDTFTSWHTYGLDWEPGELTFYMDGKVVKKHTGTDVPATPMYVILSGGVDCSAAGETGFPNDFTIAYFRWYQHAPADANLRPNQRELVR